MVDSRVRPHRAWMWKWDVLIYAFIWAFIDNVGSRWTLFHPVSRRQQTSKRLLEAISTTSPSLFFIDVTFPEQILKETASLFSSLLTLNQLYTATLALNGSMDLVNPGSVWDGIALFMYFILIIDQNTLDTRTIDPSFDTIWCTTHSQNRRKLLKLGPSTSHSSSSRFSTTPPPKPSVSPR